MSHLKEEQDLISVAFSLLHILTFSLNQIQNNDFQVLQHGHIFSIFHCSEHAVVVAVVFHT